MNAVAGISYRRKVFVYCCLRRKDRKGVRKSLICLAITARIDGQHILPKANNSSRMSSSSSPKPTAALEVTRAPAQIEGEEDKEEVTTDPSRYTVWTPWQKRFIVGGAAFCGFYNPLTAQMYLPALNKLAADFDVTPAKINLTVTTYMVFQGLTPILFSSFTDALGRRPGYIICFVVYLAANVALALASEYSQMLILRCLQSAGSATIMVLSQAVVADVITSAERGNYIALTAIPSILGPSLGPVIGGGLTKHLGWRSIFWFLTIGAGVNFILLVTLLPETCRKVVGDGSIPPPPVCRSLWQALFNHGSHRRPRPPPNMGSLEKAEGDGDGKVRFVIHHLFSSFFLLRDLELVLLLCTGGIVFSGVYAIATAAPNIFHTIYGYDDLEIGLMYLPMAAGSLIAAFAVGPGMNWNYRRHSRRLGIPMDGTRQANLDEFPIEMVRLQIALPLLVLGAAVLLTWGWVIKDRAAIEGICALIFVTGIGLVGVNTAINALIIDIYPEKAGAALAAYNMCKSLFGAAASGFIDPMIKKMGLNWAFTLLSGLYLCFVPVLLLVMFRGLRWRAQRRERKRERERSDSLEEE